MATAIALAATAFSASAAGAQARPVSTTTHAVAAQLEAETGVAPQEICVPGTDICGSVVYVEHGKFNFYDPAGQHIDGSVNWYKAEQDCVFDMIVPAVGLTAIPLGGWLGLGAIALACAAGGIPEIVASG
ncbi:MAG: hypothetical protein WA751_00880 [Candidatus Dormiibacterota bacterium]